MKIHNIVYKKLLNLKKKRVRNFSVKEINKAIGQLSSRKAQDVYGVAKEHYHHLKESTKSQVSRLVSEMLQDPKKYSSTLSNLSVAGYLYKGKGKPRDEVTSYRKISIGTFLTKAADKLMAPITQQITKKSQQGTQYGFTKNLNYLLCGVLRESIMRKRRNRGQKTFVLAVDVKNAFSTTARDCQLYELKQAGETEGIWLYSYSTYTNTWTVLRNGKAYSRLIREDRGSKQGAGKSAPDYKVYNKPLHNMITTSNLGIVEEGIPLGSVMVADDGLSILEDQEDVRQVGTIYAAFSTIYCVQFCFDKTIINVIGNDKDKENLKNSGIKIGGVDPHYDPVSVHIGLIMCEDLTTTERQNVEHRIKKTRNIMYGHLRNIIWGTDRRADTPNIEVRKKLYESLLRPSLTSGLNVFKLGQNERKDLEDLEKVVIKTMMTVRPNGSHKIIYKLLGQLPIRAHLDKGVLSLLHNVWFNSSNPIHDLIKKSIGGKFNNTTWIQEAERVLKEYGMPTLGALLEITCPDKDAWKKFCHDRITKHWTEILRRDLETMKRAELLGTTSIKLNNVMTKTSDM